MAFIVDTLSVAAGNTAKDKRAKEASNRSQARGPIIRKSRGNSGKLFIVYIMLYRGANTIKFICLKFYVNRWSSKYKQNIE